MASYQPIPNSDINDTSRTPRFPPSHTDNEEYEPQHETDPSFRPLRRSVQEEFNRPPPIWWKRVLLVIALIFMAWLSIWLGKKGMEESNKPTIIYASRYSDEHKYRPAASPVITEYLSGNRIRLRGASIGGVGISEDEIPLTQKQLESRDKKRREQAKNKAREKMGLRVKKRKSTKEIKKENEWKVKELQQKIKAGRQL
ncbi:uncharacterized protein L201_006551 [Kwoniella dendrophila CBS 6074]|uniref:BZIP domain-containing protein n=1 Tax=Kwoniella dendrophila CBS 6074 TaxID=1295534 RepID=A0AAX4K4B8_9TREE